MLQGLLRAACLALVRLYYPHRRVVGREHVPDRGGTILVANHSNGLIDPMLLRVALQREVRFLAKSTFFDQPIGRFAMESFGSIPVYRAQDRDPDRQAGHPGDVNRNEATFTLCRDALRRGEWLALFPEGTSHSDPHLRPLKTGAARIALGAIAAEDGTGGPDAPIRIVPVGFGYDAKSIFRTGVWLVFGPPLLPGGRLADFRRNERQAVEDLTLDIARALGAVLWQAETGDLLEGIARATASGPVGSPAQMNDRLGVLQAAYRTLRERDPERAFRVLRAARDHARVLGHLGVRDPWSREPPRVHPARAWRAACKLVLTAPLALAGVALWWAPYRLAGRVAPAVTRGEDDLLGTVKILAGCLFIGLTWIAEMVAAGLAWGWSGVAALALLGPAGGYAAMRFEELAGDTREALRQLGLGRGRRGAPADRRQALIEEIARALAEVSSPAR